MHVYVVVVVYLYVCVCMYARGIVCFNRDEMYNSVCQVFAFNEQQETFREVQSLPTAGAHDAEMISHNGLHLLVFSEDRDKATSHIFSNVCLPYRYFIWICMFCF